MKYSEVISSLDGLAAVRAVDETLRRIDNRLMDHGERVAFIACTIADEGKLPLDRKLLHLLCVFHDIGAYKTDEIDRMVEFETGEAWNHSAYGYLFMKYLTPLSVEAEAILYHHTSWTKLEGIGSRVAEYAALIHLADRVDIALSLGTEKQLGSVFKNSGTIFKPEYVSLLKSALEEQSIRSRIESGEYLQINKERVKKMSISSAEALEYLRMIVYSIDFRSEHTVTHTINTVSIAENIARKFGLSKAEQECIYLGALLHDVGKITIPIEILEAPGRLTPEQMTIMRTHVVETEKLISGIVPDEVLQISVRHHEKLDGSGYPRGLKASELDMPQMITAVADIVSALGSRRSYKESYPKEKTVGILREMSQKQLEPRICEYVCESYDDIMAATSKEREDVIRKYQAITGEYRLLCEKNTVHAGASCASEKEKAMK